MWTSIKGVRTKGPMAPEIPLVAQRPAEFVFSSHVQKMLNDIHATPKPAAKSPPWKRRLQNQPNKYVIEKIWLRRGSKLSPEPPKWFRRHIRDE